MKKEKAKKVEKEGFLKGVKLEMSKVVWPSSKTIIKYSIMTMVFCVFFGIMFYFLDVIFAYLKGVFS